jgi:Ca2+-binding RTX toxin-like protein
VSKVGPTGSAPLGYSTFLGGSGIDQGSGIAVDWAGVVTHAVGAHVTGFTVDADADFPTTAGAFDQTHNGGVDAFVTKLVEPITPGAPPSGPPGGSSPGTVQSCRGLAASHTGTEGDDTITGTQGSDVIAALAGNDVIKALGGDDVVCAGQGNDTATGGGGKDSLQGELGKDRLRGGSGNDKLNGGKGRDACMGGSGQDKGKCEREDSIP